jgi:cation:H+ antiporter
MIDLSLDILDGVVLLTGLIAFLSWTVYLAMHARTSDPLIKEINQHFPESINTGKALLLLIAGLAVLILGAELLIMGAVNVAKAFGLSDLIIGLTIIAVGTSLPELAASIMSIIKKEADIAIGNIIGSNIFNILAVLGIPVLIHPGSFDSSVLTRDFSIMFMLSLILGVVIYKYKKFDRALGLILLSIFLAYQSWLFTHSGGV